MEAGLFRWIPMRQSRPTAGRWTGPTSRFAGPKAFRTSIISVRSMVDLRTEIAGVRLRNPTMLASGFLDETGGSMARVYAAGAGAGVPKSIGAPPRGGDPNPPVDRPPSGVFE